MSALTYRTKKDYSTAIMDRKKAPHKLQVEDSKQDDNSIVEMTQAKMDELKIFRGDAVILKGTCTDSFMEQHHSFIHSTTAVKSSPASTLQTMMKHPLNGINGWDMLLSLSWAVAPPRIC